MANFLAEIIGWFGAGLILLAYFLLTHRKIHSHSKKYHLLNFIGGSSAATYSFLSAAYPFVAVNVIWSLVAIYGLLKDYKLIKK